MTISQTCTRLKLYYTVFLSLTQHVISDVAYAHGTPRYSTTYSISYCIYIINIHNKASTTLIFETGLAPHNAVYAVQIKQKVTMHSTAIDVNVSDAETGQKRTCCWSAAVAV